MSLTIQPRLTRKVLSKLKDSAVPIATVDDVKRASDLASELMSEIGSYAYIPGVGHGYLGILKHFGVTRFVPILSVRDMVVYYQLCSDIGDVVLKRVPGVYGAWHSVPTSYTKRDASEAAIFSQAYGSEPFSAVQWFKAFNTFTHLISNLISDRAIGILVATTDISNFYDSIEVPNMLRRLRHDAARLVDQIELLEIFLGLWGRRVSKYRVSTKGIPQEIISDASRVLAHYYLQEFDREMIEYCNNNGLTYVRWADDILVFGNSERRLESAIHHASRRLLHLGLNLNSSKTKLYTKHSYGKYRGLDALSAVKGNDLKKFRRELSKAWNGGHHENVRIDTLFRAAIGMYDRHRMAMTATDKATLEAIARTNPDLIGHLTDVQQARLVAICDRPVEIFDLMVKSAVAKPYAGPKAAALKTIRNRHSSLRAAGVTTRRLETAVKKIYDSASDSEIIRSLCVPPTCVAIGMTPTP